MTNRELLVDFIKEQCYAAADSQFRNARVIRVIDGDTIEAEIVVASKAEFGSELKLTTAARLYGINAPDDSRKAAATENLRKLIAEHCKDGAFQSELKGRDKYGRVLISIWSQGISLNQRMIDQGFAVVYLP